MSKLTSDLLREVALKQFAMHGYEGTSLALIANEVGIKKPSIYAHFKNKEELFTQTLVYAVKCELAFIEEVVKQKENKSLKDTLYSYITEYMERCEENSSTKFFIRTAFFPPMQFKRYVNEASNMYVDELEKLINSLFEENSHSLSDGISPNSAASTFLTLIDGLLVELLYGKSSRLERRKVESWNVFWNVISNEKENLK